MADGCPEKLNLEFISWVWNYSSRTRPKLLQRLKATGNKRIVYLRSRVEVEGFLASSTI